jgi:hypothetical protein
MSGDSYIDGLMATISGLREENGRLKSELMNISNQKLELMAKLAELQVTIGRM